MKKVTYIFLMFSFSVFGNTEVIIKKSVDEILKYTKENDFKNLTQFYDEKDLLDFKQNFDHTFKHNSTLIFQKIYLSYMHLNNADDYNKLSTNELNSKLVELIWRLDTPFLIYPFTGRRYLGYTKKGDYYYLLFECTVSSNGKYGEEFKVLKGYMEGNEFKLKIDPHQFTIIDNALKNLKKQTSNNK
jgi:hypothetical protein